MIYLIGSLRNPQVPVIAKALRENNYEVFDDWYAAGPNADDCLRNYYKERGFTYAQALQSYAAKHIFAFDKKYLDQCDAAVLVYPAGKSAHLELGYIAGQGKKTYILLDEEPERYDIMLQFATAVVSSVADLLTIMKEG
jgi:nucleoside 2-deoxyribosyltransferase